MFIFFSITLVYLHRWCGRCCCLPKNIVYRNLAPFRADLPNKEYINIISNVGKWKTVKYRFLRALYLCCKFDAYIHLIAWLIVAVLYCSTCIKHPGTGSWNPTVRRWQFSVSANSKIPPVHPCQNVVIVDVL